MSSHVTTSLDGPVLTITLDDAATRNAQTAETWAELARIGDQLDPSVRVVIVTGAAGVFSAGLNRAALTGQVAGGPDLATLVGASDDDAQAMIAEFQRAFTWQHTCSAVTIALVRGYAIGAGAQLALACDVIAASEDAFFSLPEVTLGLVPDLGGTGRLVQRVGAGRALTIAATGRRVGALEAQSIGLVDVVASEEGLEGAVRELVAGLCANDPVAVRAVTTLMRGAVGASGEQTLAAERCAQVTQLRALAAARNGSGS